MITCILFAIAWLGNVIFPWQSSCVGVIITKLEHLLDNVTVHKDNENILPELKANMQELKANMPEFKANLTAPKEVSKLKHDCVISWQKLSSYFLLAT